MLAALHSVFIWHSQGKMPSQSSQWAKRREESLERHLETPGVDIHCYFPGNNPGIIQVCTHQPQRRNGTLTPPSLIELEAEHCSLDSLGASLTHTDAVLLSHDVCTAMIHTHKCGLDRTHEQNWLPYIPNLCRDSNCISEYVVAPMLTSVEVF